MFPTLGMWSNANDFYMKKETKALYINTKRMKIKLAVALATVIGAANLQAIQYTLQNVNSAGSDITGGITDNTGAFLIDGDVNTVVSIGTFTNDGDVTSATSVGELLTFYTELNNDPFSSAIGDGIVQQNLAGLSAPLEGQQIYSMIGNAANLAASTQVFVYKHSGFTFTADPGPPANDLLIISDQEDILIGGFNNSQHDFGVGGGDVANFNLTVVVPEPSTTVILGIGGIVMLLRRRR